MTQDSHLFCHLHKEVDGIGKTQDKYLFLLFTQVVTITKK